MSESEQSTVEGENPRACPICPFAIVPQIVRGARTGRYFLVSSVCPHAGEVVNYRRPAPDRSSAVRRWNEWAAQPVDEPTMRAADGIFFEPGAEGDGTSAPE